MSSYDPNQMLNTILDEAEGQIEVQLRSRRGRVRALFATTGFAGGIMIIFVKVLVTTRPPRDYGAIIGELCVHIGVGFIVAALAVVAYEWGSEVRAALILSQKLQMVLASSADTAVERGAHALLMGDTEKFHGLVSSIQMVAALRHHKHWASQACLRFLGAASNSAHTMVASVSTLITDKPSLPNTFKAKSVLTLPRPDDLVDELLTGLLDGLQNNDQYYAVSNAHIWPQLRRFHSAHNAAVGRGVKIRRVFILFDESDVVLSPSETVEIIYDHFRETQSFKPEHGYEMKLANRHEYHALAPLLEHHLHFGVFKPQNGDAIEIDAITPDLSTIELSRASSDDHLESFDRFWNAIPVRNDAEVRFLLRAERIRKFAAGSRYRGISHLSDWDQPQLRRFHDETVARLRTTAITVERIFVYDKGTADEVYRFLAEHQRIATLNTEGTYRWKFHANSSDSPSIATTVMDYLPFGTFEEAENLSGQTLSELYAHERAFLFTRPDSNVISSSFDDLWNQLNTRDELSRLLPPGQVDALCPVPSCA